MLEMAFTESVSKPNLHYLAQKYKMVSKISHQKIHDSTYIKWSYL